MMNNRRNTVIDLCKLLFCIGIIHLHMNPARINSETQLIMCFGYLGVEFFFVVSGYLMANSAYKIIDINEEIAYGAETWRFILRKLKIVYPYFFLSWIIAFVIAHYSNSTSNNIAKDLLMSFPQLAQLNLAGFLHYQLNEPTWYLSATFLTMLILYPVLLRYKKFFSQIIAPIISIYIYGYLIHTFGRLSTAQFLPQSSLNTGVLRAFAGISLGCSCYEFSSYLTRKYATSQPTHYSVTLTIAEILGYVVAFLIMKTNDFFRPDFVFLILVFVSVSISFSNLSYTQRIFKKSHPWIGRLSMALYLTNYPARELSILLLPERLNISRLIPYVFINFAFAGFVMLLSHFAGLKCKKVL